MIVRRCKQFSVLAMLLIGMISRASFAVDSLEVSNQIWPKIHVSGANGEYTKISKPLNPGWYAHIEIKTGPGKFIRSWRFYPDPISAEPFTFPMPALAIYYEFKEYGLFSAINHVDKDIGELMPPSGSLKAWAIGVCDANRNYQKSQGYSDYEIHTKSWEIGVKWKLQNEIDTNVGEFKQTGFGDLDEATGGGGPVPKVPAANSSIVCEKIENEAQSEQALPGGVVTPESIIVTGAKFNTQPTTVGGDCPFQTSQSAFVFSNIQGGFQARLEAKSGWTSSWKNFQTDTHNPSTGLWSAVIDIPYTLPVPGGITGNTAGGGVQLNTPEMDLSNETDSADGQVGSAGSLQTAHTNDLIHNSLIRVVAKAGDSMVQTPYRSVTAECDPKKAGVAKSAPTGVAVNHNVIGASIEVIPNPQQCSIDVIGTVETDFNNVNVILALELNGGNLSNSRTVTTKQTAHGYIAQFSERFDMNQPTPDQLGENGPELGHMGDPELADFQRSGSYKILTSSPNDFESSTATYDFFCLNTQLIGFIDPAGEVNPNVVQMGSMTGQPEDSSTTGIPTIRANVGDKGGKTRTTHGSISKSKRFSANTDQSASGRLIVLSPKGELRLMSNQLRLGFANDPKGYSANWECTPHNNAEVCNTNGLPENIKNANTTFRFDRATAASDWVVKVCSKSDSTECATSRFQYQPGVFAVAKSKSGRLGQDKSFASTASKLNGRKNKQAPKRVGGGPSKEVAAVSRKPADVMIRKAEKDIARQLVKLWAYNQGERQAKRCLPTLRVARGGTKLEVKGQPLSILPGKTKLVPIAVENLAAGDRVKITVECRNDKNKSNNSYRLR